MPHDAPQNADQRPADQNELEDFKKKLEAHLKADGEHCSCCGRPLVHNEALAYGLDERGAAAAVGDCCKQRLAVQYADGFYAKRHKEALIAASGTMTQDDLRKLDERVDRILKNAGLPDGIGSTSDGYRAWKADDLRWFQRNPRRSHRMRPSAPGEIADSPFKGVFIPKQLGIYSIIRQVDPANRVRALFVHNPLVAVPDDEAVIHALFDHVAIPRNAVRPITQAQLTEICQRHAAGSSGRKN